MKILLSAAAFVLSVGASAQWTVVNLHPAGATHSSAHGAGDGQQVGAARLGGDYHAGFWSGTAQSWVDLTPVGISNASATDAHGGQQVGYYTSGTGNSRACLWSGTAGSFVDLHPLGATVSFAYGVHAGKQAGFDDLVGHFHAVLWSGSAASRVDLHPAGTYLSRAFDVYGLEQVGSTLLTIEGPMVASLWIGTAASWENLHPPGYARSEAFAVHNGHQVGQADEHAGLWTGTAGSWVDLHPPDHPEWPVSTASAVYGDVQVGRVGDGGQIRFASLWTGTAGSWINLHTFLPSKFTVSDAGGVWQDGAHTYVVGFAGDLSGTAEALMWVSRAVAPTTYTPVRGVVTSGNLASLLGSDNNRLVARPGIVFATGDPPVQIRVDATAPAATPNGISFSVESSASFGNAQQRIWLWNYVIDDYELVDTRLATLSDDVTHVIVRTNSSRFIQPGTLAVRALVSYRAIGPSFAYPWSARIDKIWWNFPG